MPDIRKGLTLEIATELLRGSGFGKVLLDPKYRVTWVNDVYLEYMGLPRDRLMGKDMRKLLREDLADVFADPEELASEILGLYAKRARIEQLDCTILQNGTRRARRELVFSSQIIESGTLAGGRVEVLTDVTHRRAVEQMLVHAEADWRAVVECSPDYMLRVTPAGKILYVSRTVKPYTSEDVIGTSVYAWYSETDANTIRHAFAEVLSTGEPTSYEVAFERADDSRVIFETRVAPILQDGKVRELVLSSRDVTARRETERLLVEEHERAEMYLNAVQTILLVLDPKGVVSLINDRGAQAVGYSQDELLGENWFDLCIPPRTRARDLEAFAEYFSVPRPAPYKYENEIITKSGEIRTIEWNALQLQGEKNEIIGVLCSGEDVTDRNRAVQELVTFKERLDHMLATSPSVIYTCGPAPDYPTTFISDNVGPRLGYSPNDFYADPFFWTKQIHPEDRDRILKRLSEVRAGESLTYEYRFRHQNGTYIWLLDEIMTEVDADGNITGLVGSWLNVTQRKEADEAKRESERVLTTLMSNLPGFAYRCLNDRDYTVLFISDGCKEVTGYDSHDFVERRVAYNSIIHSEDQETVAQEVQAAVDQERPFKLTYRIVAKDGTVKWVWEQGRVVSGHNTGPETMEGFITDISERIHAEQQLQATAEQLRQESAEVAEKNIALKQVLDHMEREQKTYRSEFSQEIGRTIKPVLEKLQQHADPTMQREVEALNDLVSRLLEKDTDAFQSLYLKLTGRELEICELIKSGLSSKEIAERLNLSLLTIHKHREQIRDKLGLKNQGINLSTYLRMPSH